MSARNLRLSLLLSAALAAPSLASAQTVIIGVNGNQAGMLFSTVSVPVFADMTGAGGAKLGSYTVRISWNPDSLDFQGIDNSDPAVFAKAVIQDDSSSQGVSYVAGINAAGRSGVFDLVHLIFYVNPGGNSPINVQVIEASAAGTLSSLLPFVVTVNGALCPASGRWGDVSQDGAANSRDALAILSSTVGLAVDTFQFKLPLGDVDGDTKVNSRDALIILSYGVGLPIAGQRILLPAALGCTIGATTSLKILPDTVDLVRHQEVQLVLTAIGAGGRPVSVNSVNWQVADGRLATINALGVMTGLDSGVSSVQVSIGPGVTASAPLIVRTHRQVWHVDPHVSQSTVQLGNARFPFETPELAADLVTEGDTIRIHPGTIDYQSSGAVFNVGVAIIGDVLMDGTRPLLRGQGSSNRAFFWSAGQHATVANLVFDGFDPPIYNSGVHNLTVQNVKFLAHQGDGIFSEDAMDSLLVLGDTLIQDDGGQTGIAVENARFISIHDALITGWAQGGVIVAADKVDIQRSDISLNGHDGLQITGSGNASAVSISHSRIVDNGVGMGLVIGGGTDVHIIAVHDVFTDHNFLRNRRGPALVLESALESVPVAGTTFRSLRDSIRSQAVFQESTPNWGTIAQDSIFMDSLWVQSPRDTLLNSSAVLIGRFARITNSQFLNLHVEAFTFGGNRLVVDHTSFTGCGAGCSWTTGAGIYMEDDLVNTGLGEGPGGRAKGSALISNNSFFALEAALETGSLHLVGPAVFTSNVVDSVEHGVDADIDTLSATGNVLTRIKRSGFSVSAASASGLVTVTGNQINCVGNLSTGVEVFNEPTNVSSNSVSGCVHGVRALSFVGPRTLQMFADTLLPQNSDTSVAIELDGGMIGTLRGNRIVGGGIGLYLSTVDTTVTIDSSAVSATRVAGVYLGTIDGLVIGTHNNISNNLLDGVYAICLDRIPSFTNGRFVGNGQHAINVSECTSNPVDATNNYWGTGGPPPTFPAANSVSGSGIDVTSAKATDPLAGGTVPPLAPKFFPTASVAWSTSEGTARPPVSRRVGQELSQAHAARAAARAAAKSRPRSPLN